MAPASAAASFSCSRSTWYAKRSALFFPMPGSLAHSSTRLVTDSLSNGALSLATVVLAAGATFGVSAGQLGQGRVQPRQIHSAGQRLHGIGVHLPALGQ